MNNLFEEINGLTLERSELCMFGKFCRAFLEKDPVITQKLIPHIENSIDCQSFQSNVIRIYTENHENERKRILREIEERYSHPSVMAFYAPQLALVNRKLAVKTLQDLLRHIEDNLNEYPGTLEILNNFYRHIHGGEDPEYIRGNYANYYIGSLLYSAFESSMRRMEVFDLKYSSIVLDEYAKIDIDLKKEDTQFLKYSLLSLNGNIHINNDKDSRTIRDDRIDKYFWIDIPRKLLFSIEDLISKKLISKISFRIDYVSDCIPIMEEMEFGSPLRLKISTLPELSKFYSSENYENNLWVRHDTGKFSLTFEELVEDFEIAGNDIVTQVVHLEYLSRNDEFIITHLDHEFIAYTIEEYQKRLSSQETKGHRKIKTFKIDNSMIPFNFKSGGEYFLIQVLDSYFKNTDLISEYFGKI
jgi:hypothetical protein